MAGSYGQPWAAQRSEIMARVSESSLIALFAGTCVAAHGLALADTGSLTVRKIALTGEQAFAMPPGVVYSGFESYIYNRPTVGDERVGIFALLTGPGEADSNNRVKLGF